MGRFVFFVFFLIGICSTLHGAFIVQSSKFSEQDTTKRKKDTLQVDTVEIKRRNPTAAERLEEKKEAFNSIYFWGDTKDMVALPQKGGIAVNIQKLYNKFSRKGRNSRKLQRTFTKEYKQDMINLMWLPLTKEFVQLSADSLQVFRQYFQPSLQFLQESTHYEQVKYIQNCMKNYRDSTNYIHDSQRIPKIEIANP